MQTRKLWTAAALLTASSLLLAACGARPPAGAQGPARQTEAVTSVTATSTVELSGSVEPRQSATLTWKTTGQVAEVKVQAGARVQAGDVLLTLDPASAPQSLIQAQADLLTAQTALEDLRHPSALQVANAQKAVADAQQTLADKQRALKNLLSPNVAYYQDQYRRAQQTLTTAQQNAEVTNFQTSLRNAQDTLDNAASNLKKFQDLEAQYPGYSQQHGNALENAQKTYDRAVQDYQTAQYNLEQAQAKNANAVADAQTSLTTAQANLAEAQAGPEALEQAQAEAAVAVAEASLTEAQQKLQELQMGGHPDDVAAAQAKVAAIEASLAALEITAPFDGEVLTVNNLPGDLVAQGGAAVVLANRDPLHVNVSVDESDITAVQAGNPATVTFDSLADLTLSGTVAAIDPVGQTVQGLVRYTVRVDLDGSDPRVLMGMTANVKIVTAVQAGALAVPFRAVKLDAQGEYVNRVTAAGVERVAVVSLQTQDDVVIVTGPLTPGDVVEVSTIPSTTTTGPRGPGGMFGAP
ncbi:MAG: efflux RND transporter periplasmic adaptor subunit [Anaerolineales bacterium]|nr:efflux RND transporter periplasmic adaptor subunit [Anaerolineales bacterium]